MSVSSVIRKSQLEGNSRLDPEYYQPKYLKLAEDIYRTHSCKFWGDIEGRFITGPFGSEFNVENYVPDGEYRYVRGKDVKQFFLLNDDNVYLPKKDFERLKKYALGEGDILVSVVGTLGNVSIVDHSVPPAIFSCKSTAFRTKAVNPYYLLAYLNSTHSRCLLERKVRGTVQTGLNIDDLKTLPIFIPSRKKQESIAQLTIQSKKEIDNAELLYAQAENLLLEELGLSDLKPRDDLYYTANLKDTRAISRLDAEYFQPKYAHLLQKLQRFKVKALGEIITALKKGIEVGSEAYQDSGAPFIRVSDLSKQGVNLENPKFISNELYWQLKNNYQPRKDEILLTKDATPGIAYLLEDDIKGIIAGGIVRLKVKEDIDKQYLALVISSVVGQEQIIRDGGGSVITHWKPEQIRSLLIPVLDKRIQEKLSDLVSRSHEAQLRAKELLAQAKHQVEQLIEKSA